MTTRAFDTIFVGKANRLPKFRKAGNLLDRRLAEIENGLRGQFVIRANRKLLGEYTTKIPAASIVNEAVRAFLEYVVDRAEIVDKSNLNGGESEKAKKARWPSHDRHLLAAVIGAKQPGVFVTEVKHIECSGQVQRQFGIKVIGII